MVNCLNSNAYKSYRVLGTNPTCPAQAQLELNRLKRETERAREREGQAQWAAVFVGFRDASPHLGKCPANRINQPKTLRSAGSRAKTSANYKAGTRYQAEFGSARSLTGKSDRRDYNFSSFMSASSSCLCDN